MMQSQERSARTQVEARSIYVDENTYCCCALASTVLFAGCAGSQIVTTAPARQFQISPQKPDTAQFLFVSNEGYKTFNKGSVPVYKPGTNAPAYTISEGIASPQGIAFDANANVYISNFHNNTITVYAPGSTLVLRTITENVSQPTLMVFDPRDDQLYVASHDESNVTVFNTKNGKYLRQITKGMLGDADALGIDSAGNIYVANGSATL